MTTTSWIKDYAEWLLAQRKPAEDRWSKSKAALMKNASLGPILQQQIDLIQAGIYSSLLDKNKQLFKVVAKTKQADQEMPAKIEALGQFILNDLQFSSMVDTHMEQTYYTYGISPFVVFPSLAENKNDSSSMSQTANAIILRGIHPEDFWFDNSTPTITNFMIKFTVNHYELKSLFPKGLDWNDLIVCDKNKYQRSFYILAGELCDPETGTLDTSIYFLGEQFNIILKTDFSKDESIKPTFAMPSMVFAPVFSETGDKYGQGLYAAYPTLFNNYVAACDLMPSVTMHAMYGRGIAHTDAVDKLNDPKGESWIAVKTDGMDLKKETLDMRPNLGALKDQLYFAIQELQSATGANQFLQGAVQNSNNNLTATEVNHAVSSASSRAKRKNDKLSQDFLLPLISSILKFFAISGASIAYFQYRQSDGILADTEEFDALSALDNFANNYLLSVEASDITDMRNAKVIQEVNTFVSLIGSLAQIDPTIIEQLDTTFTIQQLQSRLGMRIIKVMDEEEQVEKATKKRDLQQKIKEATMSTQSLSAEEFQRLSTEQLP